MDHADKMYLHISLNAHKAAGIIFIKLHLQFTPGCAMSAPNLDIEVFRRLTRNISLRSWYLFGTNVSFATSFLSHYLEITDIEEPVKLLTLFFI